jgi:hypothetical protein
MLTTVPPLAAPAYCHPVPVSMHSSDWIALAAVVAAPLTAAASIVFTHRGNLRLQQDRHAHERQQRLEDRQVALYVDLAEYAQDLEARLPAMTDELGVVSMPKRPEDLVNEHRLDARVRVLAPEALHHAWTEFRKAEEYMRWEGNENPDGYDPNGAPYLNWDGPVVARVRALLASLQGTLRRVMLAGDGLPLTGFIEQPTEQPSRGTTANNHGRPRQLDEDQDHADQDAAANS